MATISSLKDFVLDEDYLGAVIQLNYDTALVATTDFRQISSGGVPQNCFLTAAVPDADGKIVEVILLSVIGPEPMVIQRELVAVREELAQKQVVDLVDPQLDPSTQVKLGTQSLRCRVAGTFYQDEDGNFRFGADVDNVRGAALLKVYRPKGSALSKIASFSNGIVDSRAMLEIGKVRYSETRRIIDNEAGVFINVDDIIGNKTALFGMTRSGKSNSLKTLLQKVHQYSHNTGRPVAQLVYDPQGEYANTNSQDGSALAEIGDETQVSIYKIMEKSSNPKEHFLQFNLFKEENLSLTYELIKAEITNGISAEANYIAPLMSMDFEPLGEGATIPQRVHYNRKKLGLFALIYESLGNRSVPSFSVKVGSELAAEIVASSGKSVSASNYSADEVVIASLQAASRVAAGIMRENAQGAENRLSESWVNELKEGEAGRFFGQLTEIKEKGRNGVKAAISRIEELHSDDAEGDVRENVWRDIQAGKLIVVDLSRGSTRTSQALSELITNYLLDQASERFVSGLEPVPFQIVVEEAHNLFERDSKRNERDPWVRISKEASKYKIGLVYATQEVSSVDKRILSNTGNWIISHLSSTKETAELSNYYRFSDWSDHIRRIETKGFARFKTLSSPYIIPVQIEKFVADTTLNTKISTSKETKVPKKVKETDESGAFAPLEF